MASNNGEGEEITAIWWGNCKFSLTPGPSPKRERGKNPYVVNGGSSPIQFPVRDAPVKGRAGDGRTDIVN